MELHERYDHDLELPLDDQQHHPLCFGACGNDGDRLPGSRKPPQPTFQTPFPMNQIDTIPLSDNAPVKMATVMTFADGIIWRMQTVNLTRLFETTTTREHGASSPSGGAHNEHVRLRRSYLFASMVGVLVRRPGVSSHVPINAPGTRYLQT